MAKDEEEKMGEIPTGVDQAITEKPEDEFSKKNQLRIVAEALVNLEKESATDFRDLKALIKIGKKNLGEISADSPEELQESYKELNSIQEAINNENLTPEKKQDLIENLKNLQSSLIGLFKPKEAK